jgi:hypothetical protein
MTKDLDKVKVKIEIIRMIENPDFKAFRDELWKIYEELRFK